MTKFRKKPEVVEAITFDELIQYGIASGAATVYNSIPWSFKYQGHLIENENENLYLVLTHQGNIRFERGDMLITSDKGEIYVCKAEVFAATYERVTP